MSHSVPSVLAKNERCSAAWLALRPFLDELEGAEVSEKGTCLHIDVGGAAFLGVHPRKDGVRLTVVLDRSLDDERVVKCEAVSKRRFHNEVDFRSDDALDPDLRSWIAEAYRLRVAKSPS